MDDGDFWLPKKIILMKKFQGYWDGPLTTCGLLVPDHLDQSGSNICLRMVYLVCNNIRFLAHWQGGLVNV